MKTRINLGAGNRILNPEIYINHDISYHRKEIDVAVDLNMYYWRGIFENEYKDIEFEEIVADDVIEHLNDVINFMDNCWYLLKKGGVLKIKACGWQNPNLHVDPTHIRGFDIRSFDYFDDTTELGKNYGYYSKLRWKILDKKYDRHNNVLIQLQKL